jgi:hypothetical protein
LRRSFGAAEPGRQRTALHHHPQAASLLAAELANITGRSLTQDPAWVLLQGDVNLLFGALREQVSARRLSRH